jgi:predicted transglutaminase-like cysteine proteinase
VSRKIIAAALLATFVVVAQHANAALFSMPKALKLSPLEGVEMSLPIWGPSDKSLYCVWHLSACQPRPKPVAMFSLPKSLKQQLDRVPQDTPTLAPMAHTVFCLKYPKDCEVRKIAFRGTKFKLTSERMTDLIRVNDKVNDEIRPEPNLLGLAGEKWLIAPRAGDCNDYAVTKRHELLARGWPSRTVLLAEVVVPSGEHHLVVVVRTNEGDLVLDSLTSRIRPWTSAPYRWVRIQSGANPKYWTSVKPSARSV